MEWLVFVRLEGIVSIEKQQAKQSAKSSAQLEGPRMTLYFVCHQLRFLKRDAHCNTLFPRCKSRPDA